MKYKTADDKELWEYCRSQNDERAFTELFDRHFKPMLRFAMRYVGNSMLAEELVMDQLWNIWVKREQIHLKKDFSGYLFTCVYHSVVYHLRKGVPAVVDLEQAENNPQTDYPADSLLLYEEIMEIYHKSLEKLSPRRREMFLLSRNENLSYSEIAKKMNLSASTVDNHITAALESLRVNMKGCISVLVLFFSCLF